MQAAVQSHSEVLVNLRVEIESDRTTKHNSKLQELAKEHAEQLKAIEDKALTSGNAKDTEIQDTKDSFVQQIKDLENEHETRVGDSRAER
ncbi:hypothetical protein BGX21_004859 [Mortierella sp. AD011]|nr:hypothetical protein BGX21_004859 [Mortierella sp. AD011]